MSTRFILSIVAIFVAMIYAVIGCSGDGDGGGSSGDSRTIKITPEYLFIQSDSSQSDTETIELDKSSSSDVQINFSEISTGIDIHPESCLIPSDTCELWTIFAETSTIAATYSIPISYVGTVVSGSLGAHAIEDVTVLPSEGIAPARQIEAGFGGQSFMLSGAEVMAWGSNEDGELGLGYVSIAPSHETFNSLPTPALAFPGFDSVQTIAAGAYHSLALKGDGSVWAWGNNNKGQLGNGTTNASNTPVQVTGLTDVQAITAGSLHSLALKSDDSVWAWGGNDSGQLGNGTTDNNSTPTPVLVTGLTAVQAIAAGGSHSLALKGDGTVWSWGHNYDGELGNGTEIDSSTPVQVTGLTDVQAIAAGVHHSLALKGDGTVWAWGYNRYGQLGNGTTDNNSTPVQVAGLTDVQAIAAGSLHSLALKNDGTVWAWGPNSDGELGDGTKDNSSTPVQVTGLTDVQAIAAGVHHSLALKGDCGTAGTVWAWGDNSKGELGIGILGPISYETHPVPVWGIGDNGSGSCDMQRVTLYLTGDGNGTVSSSPGTVECSGKQAAGGQYCWLEVPQGTASVTLSATPDADSELRDWRWDCASGGTETNVTLAMDSDKNCKVTFTDVSITDNCPSDPDKTDPGICGCGVPDIDSDGNGIIDCLQACLDVSGVWTLMVSNISSSCGSELGWSSNVEINQSVCFLETTGIKGTSFTVDGNVTGSTVTIGPGIFPEDGGDTNATYTMMVGTNGNMDGNESWSWSDGVTSCIDGTADVTATKQ